jgi:hypothetical protein
MISPDRKQRLRRSTAPSTVGLGAHAAELGASEEVSMDNPLGGIMRGWPEIRGVYKRLFSGPARVRVEFLDYTLHVLDRVFFAVGRERGQLKAGNEVLELDLRTTRVFRFTGGRWRQVHHHGSINPTYSQLIRKW